MSSQAQVQFCFLTSSLDLLGLAKLTFITQISNNITCNYLTVIFKRSECYKIWTILLWFIIWWKMYKIDSLSGPNFPSSISTKLVWLGQAGRVVSGRSNCRRRNYFFPSINQKFLTNCLFILVTSPTDREINQNLLLLSFLTANQCSEQNWNRKEITKFC